jgi:hypothetical protein
MNTSLVTQTASIDDGKLESPRFAAGMGHYLKIIDVLFEK